MKSLVFTLTLALTASFCSAAETSSVAPPMAIAGLQKPGWGNAPRLAPRRATSVLVDASSTEKALTIPKAKGFRAIQKPGYGTRR